MAVSTDPGDWMVGTTDVDTVYALVGATTTAADCTKIVCRHAAALLTPPLLSVRTADAVKVPEFRYSCEVATLTEFVPIPPDVITSPLTDPSPKLKFTLLIVPSESVPFAVKVIAKGSTPVVALSTAKVLQTGTRFTTIPFVGVGVEVGLGVGVAVATGVAVGVGATAIRVAVGIGVEFGVGVVVTVPVGVSAGPMTIVAGVVKEMTFSLYRSVDPIEYASLPDNLTEVDPPVVSATALNVIVPTFDGIRIALVGLNPTDTVTLISPLVELVEYFGPSRILRKGVYVWKAPETVAILLGSYRIMSFTEETIFEPGLIQISSGIVSSTFLVIGLVDGVGMTVD